VGSGLIVLKKHPPPVNAVDLLFFNFVIVFTIIDFCIFYCVFLVNNASVVSENGEHAFSSIRLSLDFLLLGEVVWQCLTDLSFLIDSDAPNSRHN
jgi:hypothetical protein